MKKREWANMKLFITDLDGTLLKSNSEISEKNLDSLKRLKGNSFINVISTGRSLHSFFKLVQFDIPVDYLVFSSGSGIYDFNSKQIIFKKSLEEKTVLSVCKELIKLSFDFFLHQEIPKNHCFSYYYKNKVDNPDFIRRLQIYRRFSHYLDPDRLPVERANQFLVVLQDESRLDYLNEQLNGHNEEINIIRATSPLDHRSIWIEIFQKEVSKSKSARFLQEKLQISHCDTYAIGNDYNDVDLLLWANSSFVVDNAPVDIKRVFYNTKSNNEDGVSEIVKMII